MFHVNFTVYYYDVVMKTVVDNWVLAFAGEGRVISENVAKRKNINFPSFTSWDFRSTSRCKNKLNAVIATGTHVVFDRSRISNVSVFRTVEETEGLFTSSPA